jgi:hypothetical protein
MDNMKMKIAFGCQSRTGKSSSVDFLISKHGGVEKSFSSPIYEIMHYTQKKCGFEEKKDRDFLQIIGTWGRNKDPSVWINSMDINEDENIFVSDVRFNNEFDFLKKNGFIMIRILRDLEDIKDFGNGDIKHLSETELIYKPLTEWDYIIKNNESLDIFYKKLDEIIYSIKTNLK